MWRRIASCASAVITGPISVSSRSGRPTRSSPIAPRSIPSRRSAISSCTSRTRSAEQRWPATFECRGDDVGHGLLRQRRANPRSSRSVRRFRRSAESVRRRIEPPGQSCAGSTAPTSVEPVNTTPACPDVGDQRRADRPVARQQLQRAAWHPRLVQQPHGGGRDQRRLLRRLRQHDIAGRQRGGDLPDEDRQRKVPRADATTGPERRCVALSKSRAISPE